MPGSLVDISPLGLSVRSRPVTGVSSELVQAYGGDVLETGFAIAESFGPDGQWCEVGGDLHTVSSGDVEIRLRLRPDAASWEAGYFDASWGEGRYACVPPDRRVTVAAYVDRMQELTEGLVQESDLRAAAAEGGFPAVDRLVRHHVGVLDEQYAALDSLHCALTVCSGTLPHWALALVRDEAESLNTAREWLTSAVVAYHHGSAGRRPDTLFGGVCFAFSTGSVDLARY